MYDEIAKMTLSSYEGNRQVGVGGPIFVPGTIRSSSARAGRELLGNEAEEQKPQRQDLCSLPSDLHTAYLLTETETNGDTHNRKH